MRPPAEHLTIVTKRSKVVGDVQRRMIKRVPSLMNLSIYWYIIIKYNMANYKVK